MADALRVGGLRGDYVVILRFFTTSSLRDSDHLLVVVRGFVFRDTQLRCATSCVSHHFTPG